MHLTSVFLTSLLICLLSPTSAIAVTKNGFDLSNSILDSKDINSGGPEKDGIFALTYPKFIPAKASQLAGSERVLSVAVNDTFRAYPLRKLREYGKECFTAKIAGQTIRIEWDDANDSPWITHTGGEPILSLTSFWFAWFTFYPETQIFGYVDNAYLNACQLNVARAL